MTMDVRKVQTPAAAKEAGKWLSSLDDIKQEFRKISWTTKDELFAYTKIVVGATFAVGLGVYVLDLCLQGVLSGLIGLMHTISG